MWDEAEIVVVMSERWKEREEHERVRKERVEWRGTNEADVREIILGEKQKKIGE